MLVTIIESMTLACPFRRNADGSDATCINVACMLWKFSDARCPRTGLQFGRCGMAAREAGSWRLPIANGVADRAHVHAARGKRANAQLAAKDNAARIAC